MKLWSFEENVPLTVFRKGDLHCVTEIRAYWVEQNLLRSITLDIITKVLDNAAFVCVHVVGRFSKDFSDVRG